MNDFWSTLRGMFWDTQAKHGRASASPHRAGRRVLASVDAKRKAALRAKGKAASKMRKIQMRRDKGSSKRRRG